MSGRSGAMNGVLFTSMSALLYAALPIFTKLAYGVGANAETFNFYKSAWAIPVLAVALAVRKKSIVLPRRLMLWAIVAGLLAKGVTSLLLFYSYNYISSGMSTTLHFMYPLFAALLGYLFFRDRLPIYKWVAIVAATLAVVLMVDTGGGGDALGVLYAVLSAVVYAAYILVVDKGGVSKIDPMVFAFYLAVSGSVFSLAFGLSTGSMKWSLGWEPHLYMLAAAIFTSVVASACFQQGIRRLGGASAAFFSLLEPAGSCVLGALVLQEHMSWKAMLGIAIVLGAVLAMVWFDHRAAQKELRHAAH